MYQLTDYQRPISAAILIYKEPIPAVIPLDAPLTPNVVLAVERSRIFP